MLKHLSFKKWEIFGFFWIVILGSLLHFTGILWYKVTIFVGKNYRIKSYQ